MRVKNKNKGFSLVEVIIAVAILAVCVTLLAPSLVTVSQKSRVEKDIVKFESICVAFKTALAEPEVRKEAELIGGGGKLVIVCNIDPNGVIIFGESEVTGTSTATLKNTKLWANSYQAIGINYEVENQELNNDYLVFTLTPKTSVTTAQCTYEIIERQS